MIGSTVEYIIKRPVFYDIQSDPLNSSPFNSSFSLNSSGPFESIIIDTDVESTFKLVTPSTSWRNLRVFFRRIKRSVLPFTTLLVQLVEVSVLLYFNIG